MIKKYSGVGALVVAIIALVIALGGTGIVGPQGPQGPMGSASGPDKYNHQFFNAGSTDGGRRATTTTAATYTMTAQDFKITNTNTTATYMDWLPNVNTTLSLNGTSTLDYVPNIGDVATIYLRNASSTSGATITLAAEDAGLDLQYTEATGGDLVLNGLDWAELTIIRESANLTTVIFSEFKEAD